MHRTDMSLPVLLCYVTPFVPFLCFRSLVLHNPYSSRFLALTFLPAILLCFLFLGSSTVHLALRILSLFARCFCLLGLPLTRYLF